MKKTLFALFMSYACCALFAQSVQYGYTEEYNGSKDKTPLANVNISAGGSTAKSGKDGKFKLEFNTLKVGDRVSIDINTVAFLKNYVIFNKEALEQWTVSGKGVYFRIVLCKKKTFDNLVMTYYNVSDKSLKEQLNKERINAQKQKEQGAIQQQEYERLLKEADDRYQNAIRHMRENAELVARIDENELEGNQAEILNLAKEGRLDEAVSLIRQDSTALLLEKTTKKLQYGEEQERQARQIQEEAKNERAKLIANLKNNIKILQLHGGKENYDLCAEYWQKIIEADTTDLDNLKEGANFFYNQNDFELTERYYFRTLAACEKLYKDNPDRYAIDYVSALNNMGCLHDILHVLDKAESYYMQALQIMKSLAERYPEKVPTYARELSDIGSFYCNARQYDKSEMYNKQAVELMKPLAESNPDAYNPDYALFLRRMGNLYKQIRQYDLAELHYTQALNILNSLAESNPDKYKPACATLLASLGAIYSFTRQYDKAESYSLQSFEIRKSLAERNPDAYNPDYTISLNNLAILYYNLNQLDKAESYFLQTLAIEKILAEVNPDAYLVDYANALSNIAAYYNRVNQMDKAEVNTLQALEILKSLAESKPDAYNEYYAYALYNMGNFYATSDHLDKAELYYLHAVMIQKSLADSFPKAYNPGYVSTLINLGTLYSEKRQYEKAESYLTQASMIMGTDTAAYMEEYITTIDMLAVSILFQGRYNEAEQLVLRNKELTFEGKTLKDYILEDLKQQEEDGTIPNSRKSDVERLRKRMAL